MLLPALDPVLARPPHASAIPLEQLAANAHLPESEKLREACRQFEAVLLREILRETRKTVIASGFGDDSTASAIYQDMVTDQLAESISRSGAVGLARQLETELMRQAASATHVEDSPCEH